MEGYENFVVDKTDTVRTAMEKIDRNRHRTVIVTDGDRVVGTVSDGDIRRAFLDDVMPIAPVEKVMNLNCRTTTSRDPEEHRRILREDKILVLPVVDEEGDLVDVATAYEPFGGESEADGSGSDAPAQGRDGNDG